MVWNDVVGCGKQKWQQQALPVCPQRSALVGVTFARLARAAVWKALAALSTGGGECYHCQHRASIPEISPPIASLTLSGGPAKGHALRDLRCAP